MTIQTEFFIAFTEGYDEPITIYGPFDSYEAAVYAHYKQAAESGAFEGEDPWPNPLNYYLQDDAVRIARLDREITDQPEPDTDPGQKFDRTYHQPRWDG